VSSVFATSKPKVRQVSNANSYLPSWEVFLQTGLLNRILMTITLLAFYRLGVQVPLSGINHELLKRSTALNSDLLGLVDLFAGGALSALSVFALGIGPYITASIMMQLLNEVFPSLKAMQQEQGESGRKEYQQWVRRLSILLALIQSFALTRYLYLSGLANTTDTTVLFYTKSIISLMAGSAFVMWIGELISEFGIGNGGSILIFAGIAARLPQMVKQTYTAWQTGTTPTWGIWTLIVFFALIIIAIIYIQDGLRKLPITGARAVSSPSILAYGVNPNAHYLPIKVNPAGVLPIIFASATMFLPMQLLTFVGKGNSSSISQGFSNLLLSLPFLKNIFASIVSSKASLMIGRFTDRIFSYATWEHSIVYLTLIVLFAFFYASILLNPREIAENLQKGGSAIQGIKPGKPTGEYIERVLNRIVFIGALAIGLVTILPIHVEKLCQITTLGGLGSTSLIIMVGVALDLHNQIIAYSQAHQYKVRSILSSR
jgi:preprotein translocase subunit SecY